MNGWVVSYGDVERLADAMMEAATLTPGVRADMARLNRERVATRANWSANFPRYIEFLQGLTETCRTWWISSLIT